jgi:HAD superfamily hydrolase (TIGR01509 family)
MPLRMTFPNPVKAVVFDMDGLLFDTEAVFRMAMVQAGAEYGASISDAFYASLIGFTPERGFVLMRARFGATFPAEDFFERCHVHFRRLLDRELRMKPGVIDLLDVLDRRQLPRAIATSSKRASVDHHLAHFGLTDRFDAIVAHGDYPQGKPHPAPYLLAAQALGVRPEHCLALEDSYNGVRSGVAAGMMTVMVPDLLPATDDMRQLAVLIADDLIAVRDLLAGRD